MPVFIALIILGATALWFALCFSFRSIGKFFASRIDKVKEQIKDEEENITDEQR